MKLNIVPPFPPPPSLFYFKLAQAGARNMENNSQMQLVGPFCQLKVKSGNN